jgi:hypothetical protein
MKAWPWPLGAIRASSAVAWGGPKRGIALLEIGKLEGPLESSLRDPRRREASIAGIAERIVAAIELGLGINPTAWCGWQRASSDGSASQFWGG